MISGRKGRTTRLNNQIQRNIRFFIAGKLSATLGSSIYGFAIGLYILEMTGSSLNFSITLLLTVLPRIILAPIAGSLSDQIDRKKIIVFSDFACAVWLGIIFIIFTSFYESIYVLYLATFVLSSLNTFYGTAFTSSIYNMVGPDNIQKAMSLNQMIVSVSTILGPVLGGLLFGFVNISTFMIVNIITFTFSGIVSLFIQYNLFKKENGEKAVEEEGGMLSQIKSGLHYVKTNQFLKNLIFLAFILNFWVSVFPVSMPYLVLQVRGMESYQLGIIEGSLSVGMLVMSIILSQRPEIKEKGKAMIGGLTGLALILIIFGAPNVPILSDISNTIYFPYLMILAFVLAICLMFVNMPIMVILQKTTPDEYRGRVMSLLEMGASSLTPLGYILFGYLLEFTPVWILLAICGVSIIILIILTIKKKVFLQSIKAIDREIAPSV